MTPRAIIQKRTVEAKIEKFPHATLYLGDCLEILPTLPRAAALISDPPYGQKHNVNVSKQSDGRKVKGYAPIRGDDKPFDPAHMIPAADIVLLWGAHKFYARLPPDTGRWLFWDKRCDVLPEWDQGCGEMAWLNQKGVVRVFRHPYGGFNGISMAAGEEGTRVHPTQKPIELMKWCITQCKVPAGGTVLDPYMGSASTGVAALDMHHPFIGIECELSYYDVARRRIEVADRPGFIPW